MTIKNMRPYFYMCLKRRQSNIIHQYIDFYLTSEGMENPQCTIIPIGCKITINKDGNAFTRYYLYYADKWFETTITKSHINYIICRVSNTTKSVYDEISAP